MTDSGDVYTTKIFRKKSKAASCPASWSRGTLPALPQYSCETKQVGKRAWVSCYRIEKGRQREYSLINQVRKKIRWLSIIRPQMWWQPHLLAWSPPLCVTSPPRGTGHIAISPEQVTQHYRKGGSPSGGGGASSSEILVRLIFWLQFTEFLHFAFSFQGLIFYITKKYWPGHRHDRFYWGVW